MKDTEATLFQAKNKSVKQNHVMTCLSAICHDMMTLPQVSIHQWREAEVNCVSLCNKLHLGNP